MTVVIERGPDEEEDDSEDDRPTKPTPEPAEATPLPTSRPSRPGRRGADDTGDWVVVVDLEEARRRDSAIQARRELPILDIVSARHR